MPRLPFRESAPEGGLPRLTYVRAQPHGLRPVQSALVEAELAVMGRRKETRYVAVDVYDDRRLSARDLRRDLGSMFRLAGDRLVSVRLLARTFWGPGTGPFARPPAPEFSRMFA